LLLDFRHFKIENTFCVIVISTISMCQNRPIHFFFARMEMVDMAWPKSGPTVVHLRQAAMSSLAQMGEAGVAALAGKLEDADAIIRCSAVETLAQLGPLAAPHASTT
jgi:hypothetical protein